jgi:sugar (pentulose or hexulose) kinase
VGGLTHIQQNATIHSDSQAIKATNSNEVQSMQTWLVGLDVGTTSCKAVVMTPEGREVASGRAPTPWTTTAIGTQTGGEELVVAARAALSSAVAAAPAGRIVGVGVASMAESGVLLSREGTAVAPVIAWHDTRDETETGDLRTQLGAEFSVRTGLPMRQQWSLTKHRWQLDHDDAAALAVRRLGVAEWIVHALGGDQVSEQSLASRTGWLDLARRDWWDEALAWSGAPHSLLPELVASGEPVGTAHDRWDIPGLAGATLTVAGHDHQAAAIGADAARLHAELDSCGTAEAYVRTVPPALPAADIRALTDSGITVGWHALPEHWCLLGATRGGLVLQRILALLGRGRADLPALDAAALDVAALGTEPGALTVTGADGSDVGVHHVGDDVNPARVWRAALAAAVDAGRDIHDAMTRASGAHQDLVVTGGWAHSTGVLTLKRRALGELRIPHVGEAGARGAALLAGSAAGVYATPADHPRPVALEPSPSGVAAR